MKSQILTLALLVIASVTPPQAARGASGPHAGVLAVGTDQARVFVPQGIAVEDYENDGYRLRVVERSASGSIVEVVVRLAEMRSKAAEARPAGVVSDTSGSKLATLAQHIVRGARDQEETVERLLSWVARNVRYELDRSQDQAAEAVLERRSAYCTGLARLSVALLGAAGVEAREVAGFSFEPGGGPPGYHRWIEVWFPDLGWRFADPKASLDFVAATYVRIASQEIPTSGEWRLIERSHRMRDVATASNLPTGTRRAAQGQRPAAAALRVTVPSDAVRAGSLEVRLEGPDWTWTRSHDAGISTRDAEGREQVAFDFVGLRAGRYQVAATWTPAASHQPNAVEQRVATLIAPASPRLLDLDLANSSTPAVHYNPDSRSSPHTLPPESLP